MSAGVCVRYKKKIKYRPIVGRGCLLIFLFSGPSLFLLGFLEIRVLFLSGGELWDCWGKELSARMSVLELEKMA